MECGHSGASLMSGSTWGNSWGSCWGNTWGAIDTSSGGGFPARPRVTERFDDDDDVLLLVLAALSVIDAVQ